MRVHLTDALCAEAGRMADIVTANLRPTNYTGLNVLGRYYVGYLGELTFLEALRATGKAGRYTPRLDGRSDDGSDVVVGISGQLRRVDVKTASKPSYRYLMMPTAQFDKPGAPSTLVAVRLEGHYARLMGVCDRLQLRPAPPGALPVPTMQYPFDHLTTIAAFIAVLDDGAIIVEGVHA